MSDRPLAYGVDFGTTNTVLAAAYRDRAELVPLDGETVMPSVTYLHRNNSSAAGHAGIRQFLITGNYATRCGNCDRVLRHKGEVSTHCKTYRWNGGCRDSRIITAIKSELAGERSFTHSWGKDFELVELVEIILRQAKQSADRALKRRVNRAVIGYPIAFPATRDTDDPRQQGAMKRLETAARRAGFKEIVFVREPVAALTGVQQRGTVVACDFGGGTFDVAIMQGHGRSRVVTGLRGASVGGGDVDQAIFDAKIAPAIGLPARAGGEIRRELRTLNGALQVLRVPTLRQELKDRARDDPGGGFSFMDAVLEGGHAYALYEAIERAKIKLSDAEETTIELRRPGVELAVPIKRSELDELVAPLLNPIGRALDAALDDAGVDGGEIDLVTRTGGASEMPAFQSLLQARFAPQRVQTQESLTAIAQGLAAYARQKWG